MNLRVIRSFRGPNLWTRAQVIEMQLEGDLWESWPIEKRRETMTLLADKLLPNESAWTGTSLRDLALLLGRIVQRLQELAKTPIHFVGVSESPESIRIAVEYRLEPVGLAAAAIAQRRLNEACCGKSMPLEEDLNHLGEVEYSQRFPASTACIYNAALARDIPAEALHAEYSRYLRLGQGSRQFRLLSSEPNTIGAVARTSSTDKYLAKDLLRAAGVPVPIGRLVETAEDAWKAACELGLPVAMKPLDSDLATGVSLDLREKSQVEAGFVTAHEHSHSVLVERFAPGLEHRVLVVDDRVVAVTRIEPPQVEGDGVSTVAQLVAKFNSDPRRGNEQRHPLSTIKIDQVALGVLEGQGLTLDSIPPARKRVMLRRNPPYFKFGGVLVDLTDVIHPSIAAHAIAAAQTMQIQVAGLDVVAVDITRPLEEQGGVVVEINAGPGLWLHLAPWADSPRPIGAAIVASLFPEGSSGRIPVVALCGDGNDLVRQHLIALLKRSKVRAGAVHGQSIELNARQWTIPDTTPQARAQVLFQNPTVDVAILETTPRELIESGFGNDRADVAILLEANSSPVTVASLAHALGTAGIFVLLESSYATLLATGFPADRIILLEPSSTKDQTDLLAACAATRVLGLESSTDSP